MAYNPWKVQNISFFSGKSMENGLSAVVWQCQFEEKKSWVVRQTNGPFARLEHSPGPHKFNLFNMRGCRWLHFMFLPLKTVWNTGKPWSSPSKDLDSLQKLLANVRKCHLTSDSHFSHFKWGCKNAYQVWCLQGSNEWENAHEVLGILKLFSKCHFLPLLQPFPPPNQNNWI